MSYWSDRQEKLKKAMEKDEDKLKKRLSSFYDREQRKLEKYIASYYSEYGKNNVIQYRDLMERISESDRRLLIEQMDKFAAKYPQYTHLLPIRESIYKLNRLEGLEHSIKMQQLEIGAVNNDEITKYLNEQALKGVNAAAEVMGFGNNFYSANSDIVKQFIDVPWSNGENFSSRIWQNADKLAAYLNTDIAQGFARGDSYDKLVKQVQHRFSHVARNDAYRLIYTEGTYVMAESSIQPFIEDFEQYRVSTVGDGKVCSICNGVSDKVFDIINREPGVNFPPFHPWCRCSFEIVVDDWDKWVDDYEKKHNSNAVPAKDIEKNLSNSELTNRRKNRMAQIITIDNDVRTILSQKEIIERAKKYGEEAMNNPKAFRYKNGDPITDFVNRKLGYDKLPQTVSEEEFDILKKGKKVLYRGVTDVKGITSDEMVEAFKHGEFFAGHGVYGYGTYTDIDKNIAEYYAMENGSGKIMEMLLSDDAHTVNFVEIFTEYEKTGIPKIIGEKPEAFQDILGNVGTYAAIKGYDAILLGGFQNKQHVIILNRGKVIIKE